MNHTAIFGGTFNPAHLGHREMLVFLSRMEEIQTILVMPVNIPPHKKNETVSSEHRLQMCRLAFADIPKVQICREEISRQGRSYTVDTLEDLSRQGIKQPLLVMGADSLVDFTTWHRYGDILSMASLLVYKRAGTDLAEMKEQKAKLEALGGEITIMDFCPPDISSTEIRNLLKAGGSVAGLVPQAVAQYILNNKLYSGETKWNQP